MRFLLLSKSESACESQGFHVADLLKVVDVLERGSAVMLMMRRILRIRFVKAKIYSTLLSEVTRWILFVPLLSIYWLGSNPPQSLLLVLSYL